MSSSYCQGALARVAAAAVAAALMALPAAASFAAGDAAMYRGGSSLTGVYPEDLSTPLALQWKFTSNYFGYNPSSPAVVGDMVYFASGNRIYALDAASGSLKWRYPQDQPLSTTIRTSPAVADGIVFFGAEDGKVYAITADTGRYEWAFDTRSSVGSSPTIVNGVLYFGAGDGRLWAVDVKTHQPPAAWRGGLKTTDEIAGSPAVSNGFVYALSLDQVLHAVGAATGKERWSYRLTGSVLRQSPVVSGDYLYVANGQYLTSLLARNGVLRRNWILNSEITVSPAVTDSAIYIVTSDNRVHALDPRLGREKWKVLPKLEYDVIAPPTVAGRTLIVGTTLGGIYGIDTETGALKWSYSITPASTSDEQVPQRTNVAAAPVVVDKTLYVLSDDGSLSSFRADAIDTAGPVVSDIEPDMGVEINGAPPLHFQAKIADEGSGINPSTVKFLVDGQGVQKKPAGRDNDDKPGYKFDPVTSTLTFDTVEAASAGAVRNMPDGRHTVSVVAADWMGNTSTKTWSFTVDNSLAKLARRKPENLGIGGPQGSGGLQGGGRRGGGSGRGGGLGGNRGGGGVGRPGGA